MNITKLLKNDYYLNSSISFFRLNFEKKLKFIKQDFRRIEKKFHKVQYSLCKTEMEKREVIDFVIKKKSEQYIREGSWNFLELDNYRKFIKLFVNNKDLQLNYLKINDNLGVYVKFLKLFFNLKGVFKSTPKIGKVLK